MGDHNVSDAKIEVLVERVNSAIEDISGLKKDLKSLDRALEVIIEFRKDAEHIRLDVERLHKSVNDNEKILVEVVSITKQHSFIWKLIGGCSGILILLTGWVSGQFTSLSKNDNDVDKRVSILEYRISPHEINKQPTLEKEVTK
ncbi:hypothetical protein PHOOPHIGHTERS_54 [Serratia phage vB_SmaS_PhooPhighters]|uniref:Uncharacterized protein n=1 Tax=Serratia phage vB_SmaS_Rovert TaxID=2777363 RepID=A0A7T3N9T1_9CAUD|nr:hypothetical protein QJS24_gp46 [Serratia phage vB_SmaS_Rovert]QPX75013.1 hypothetical protein [Serratia phage vB_SmaS_Rovert]UGO51988.1 hypothetical protein PHOOPHIGHTERS_54 [Serratia phage vB_SmaS_PhooPhighters]